MQGKFTKTGKILLAFTAGFLLLLAGLTGYRVLSGQSGSYTVETEHAAAASEVVPAPQKINLNTATVEDLTALPGIGEKLAQRIVDYRLEHGNFGKKEEIQNVKGIGSGIYSEIEDQVTVEDEG